MSAVPHLPRVLSGNPVHLPAPLRSLTPEQVCRIDAALARVGAFGEVRLIVHHGRVRFIQVLSSEDISSGAPYEAPEARPARARS